MLDRGCMLARSTGRRQASYTRLSVVRLHKQVPLSHRLMARRVVLSHSNVGSNPTRTAKAS